MTHHPHTRLIHGSGSSTRGYSKGATLPPLYYSTAFAHPSAEAMEAVFAGKQPGLLYSRLQNPTVAELEARISDACGAKGTLAVASGMSALALGLLGLLKAGDRILSSRYLFGSSYALFKTTLKEMGIATDYFDPRDPKAAEALIGADTRLVFLEAIANPTMVVPDFSRYRALCAEQGIPLVVDATLLTPYLFDAQALGADIALFSASKYIAGAASIIGGLIVDTGRYDWQAGGRIDLGDFRRLGADAYLSRLRQQLMATLGPNLAPMNAFLLMLGLETLGLRLDRQGETTVALAGFLRDHPRVREVRYPGLPGSADWELVQQQFRGNGGAMLALRLESREACFCFLNRLNLITRAVNLGDTRSIAVHPASTIYGQFWPTEQELLGITEDMIRFSVGLEDAADLIADLEQALSV